MTALMSVDAIRLEPTLFPRAAIDEATVARYADAIAAGETLPPVIVDTEDRLLDGWHRHNAHTSLGLAEITVERVAIPEGVPPRLFAASLSARHGLPLAEDDARALARELYAVADADAPTIASVAKALGRARKTVEGWVADVAEQRRVTRERERQARNTLALLLRELGWTQQRIATTLGIAKSTISEFVRGDLAMNEPTEDVLQRAVLLSPDEVRPAIAEVADRWREERIFATWTEDERQLLKQLRSGETVVVNMREDAHKRLWQWAEQARLAVRVDRSSQWGNPYLVGDDGDRDTVCDHYEQHYLPFKPSLHGRIPSLQGKALGCWCAPARCHGDLLRRMAEADG